MENNEDKRLMAELDELINSYDSLLKVLRAKCDKYEKENKDIKQALKQLVDVLPKGESLRHYFAKDELGYARGILVLHNEALSAGEGEVKCDCSPQFKAAHGECYKCPGNKREGDNA